LLQYIENQGIDRLKWDACIEQSSNGLIYAFSWWLDAVTDHWDALILGNYEAVLPLVWNQKWGFKSIYPPFEIQQLGVFAKKKLTQQQFEDFVKAIPSDFQRIQLRLNSHNNFRVQDFSRRDLVNYVLPLNLPYEKLRKQYGKNTLRNVKKAAQQEFYLDKNYSVKECVQLFKQLKENELGLGEKYYERILVAMEEASSRNMGRVVGVLNKEEKLYALAFFGNSHQRLYNLMPATSPLGRKQGAMFFLIDALIQEYAGSSYLLDFEGSMQEGVARFYKGFGGKIEPYYLLERQQMKWYWKGLLEARSWIENR